jgi:hypothetical protein
MKRKPKPAASCVTLWRPEIVLAPAVRPIVNGPAVTLATPADRPHAIQARLDAAQSLLTSVAEARRTFGAQAAIVQTRAQQARSTRELVSATMETYRIEAALDGVLTGTLRQMTALMEERDL